MEKVRTKEDVREIFAARSRVRQLEARLIRNGKLAIPIQRRIAELRHQMLRKYDVIL